MAFVMKDENEDKVSFYVKDKFGKTHVIIKCIERGDNDILRYYIKQIYHSSKEYSNDFFQKLIYL